MQNISFQGRSNLVFSNVRFSDLADFQSTQRRKCSKTNNQFLTKRTYGVDMETLPVVVFVRNDNEGIIQRYTRGIKNDELLMELAEAVNKLKETAQTKMTAWIIGGKAQDDKTTKVVNEIADVICDRPDIDASILTGEKFNTTSRIFIRGNSQGSEIIFPEIKDLKTSNDVEEMFDIVELNNTQVLF
jgi:hypothetical protein